MSRVYKNAQSEAAVMALYDRQMKSLNISFVDLYPDTRFGKAHVVKLGKPDGKPLLFFHGGNSTTPYSLSRFPSLLKNFCIYSADIVGHPGKSSQTVVSHKTMEYGQWAGDVISSLGFDKISCIGNSYGGGVLVKLMCATPEKVEKAVLIVPSGIANVSTFNVSVKMGIPMIGYVLTKSEKWLKRAILPMAMSEQNIDAATYEMVKASFEHAAVKAGMPSNVKPDELRKCTAPTLLIAAQQDCMFPGEKVIEKAKGMIPNLTTYLLKGQGHMYVLPEGIVKLIETFLEG